MAEETSKFSEFWQKSMDKVSSTVKFMPNATKANNGKDPKDGDAESSELTPKQKRRAQVRKAQIEHRQRKENYIKHLEKDVLDLKAMIAKTESQSVLYQTENAKIRSKLMRSNIPISITLLPSVEAPDVDFLQPAMSNSATNLSTSVSPQPTTQWPSTNPSSSNETLVSIGYDPFTDHNCLQISPMDQDIFAFDNDAFLSTLGQADFDMLGNVLATSTSPPATDPTTGNSVTAPQSTNTTGRSHTEAVHTNHHLCGLKEGDVETIAINFILALEHPCLACFTLARSPHTAFDPTGVPSNHALMAMTPLYHSAPAHIFDTFFPLSQENHNVRFRNPDVNPKNQYCLPSQQHSTQNQLQDTNLDVSIPGREGLGAGVGSGPTEQLQWSVPTPEISLKGLREMSNSLPKGDWEITPVQGWFMLVERVGIENLLGKEVTSVSEGEERLGQLKKGLTELIQCWGFGAVMDEARFWDVVGQVLGEDVIFGEA